MTKNKTLISPFNNIDMQADELTTGIKARYKSKDVAPIMDGIIDKVRKTKVKGPK